MVKLLRQSYLAIVFVCNLSYSHSIDHWETIIQVGDSCKYFVPTSEIGSDWKKRDFDDSSWTSSKSGFGYGDNDDSTEVATATMTVYMRFKFDVANKSDIGALLLDMDFDDAFIAYLNGIEVARANIEDPVAWNMELNAVHEAALYKVGIPERFVISEFIDSHLFEGENVLAIEIHNQSASSSDLSSNVFFHAGITSVNAIYRQTPNWFWEPIEVQMLETHLPLMIIETNGQTIPDEPRIVADMGLIFNGENEENSVNDPWNEYSGKISIEQRGESSSGFEKKSYSIELQNEDGSNNNVSILGFPKENDFVLYGPYSDKTMIKNVLSYELFRRTGRWAPGTRYIELILNDDYRGVYVLTEKLKRDENRVDIDKLTSEDVSKEDISGGYILRRDKKTKLPENAPSWWTSSVDQPYHQRMWYEYFDPEYEDLTNAQANYIRAWMQNFDGIMSSQSFSDPAIGYRQYVKVNSFIDMMFVNEISKGVDNYLFSTYFYKENDADGGRFVAGPPWDYNIAYGNVNYGEGWNASETYGWCYTQGGRTYWYERMMEDEAYRNKVYCRWSNYRAGIYSDERVINIIDSCVSVIGDAVDRNYIKYPTLGQYVWPAKEPFPQTYQGEIDNMKSWLLARLSWIDTQWLISGTCTMLPPIEIKLSNNIIHEDVPIGSIIGYFNSTDPDSDEHSYKLVAGNGDNDNADFLIRGNKLRSDTKFDSENKNTFYVRIRSEDDTGESFEKAFIIHVTDQILGIDEEGDHAINLFPNPTGGAINIFGNQQHEVLNVQLNEISGRLISNYHGRIKDINIALGYDSSSLKSGVYIIRIYSEGQVTARRFIKL